MKARNARFLQIAIAASLFVHVTIAAVVHSHPVRAAEEPKPTHLHIVIIVRPSPTPPPRRTRPKPVHQAVTGPPHRPHVNLVRVAKNGNHPGPASVVPSANPGPPGPEPGPASAPPAEATASPGPVTPAATPKPACSAPDVAAKAIEAVTPQTPTDAQGIDAQAKVKVDLDASGSVTNATIYATTGSQELDMAAVRAAKASRYAPEERNCKTVPGSYLFTVDFQE